ncbi:MAG: phosphoribosyl-ATP diphosphatase [Eggerthellaceae bacterium]|nr:phosphoribosyl-ATP diphosphatase [Eggerthellaceae bacterium]
MDKIYFTEGERPISQVGSALETLAQTIHDRRDAGEGSYTYRLLSGSVDAPLKKLMEEASEVALAAKDVESWAASSIAATLGFEAAAGEEADAVSVQLPAEYDEAIDHLRYEAGDVVYHLLVILERYGISLDEFAAEMNARMTEDAIALREGVAMLQPQHVKRGK